MCSTTADTSKTSITSKQQQPQKSNGMVVPKAYPVDNGHSIVEAESEEKWPTEGDAGQQYVSDPLCALHLCVVGGSHVATDAGSQCIQHYQGCEEAAPVVGVEDPHTGQHKYEDGKSKKLHPRHTSQQIDGRFGHASPPFMLNTNGLGQHRTEQVGDN